MRRYGLRADQSERLKDLLPGCEGHVSVTAKDNRKDLRPYDRDLYKALFSKSVPAFRRSAGEGVGAGESRSFPPLLDGTCGPSPGPKTAAIRV